MAYLHWDSLRGRNEEFERYDVRVSRVVLHEDKDEISAQIVCLIAWRQTVIILKPH